VRAWAKRLAWLIAITFLPSHLVCPAASARPSRLWSFQSISETAELIVVGEVIEVVDRGPIAKEETRWNIPLRRMETEIRILRTFPRDVPEKLHSISLIRLEYNSTDHKKVFLLVNGPSFPHFSVGDIYAFPLRRSSPKERPVWELIDEENNGLLVPGATKPLRPDGKPQSGVEFLLCELVSAFVNGRYQDMTNAAKMLYSIREPDVRERFNDLLLMNIVQDKDRWTQIALAAYCSLSRNYRPRVDSLPATLEGQQFRLDLTRTALRQLPRSESDSLLIREAVKQTQSFPFEMANMLSNNYPRHPTAISVLREALKQPTPEMVFVASRMTKGATHPLFSPAANAAARLFVRKADFSPPYLVSGAAKLILRYGNENQQAQLLGLFRDSREQDREKFEHIWAAVENWAGKEEHFAFYATALADSGSFRGGQLPLRGRRICDSAVKTLQHRMDVDFGYDHKQSESERDEAVAKAKAWLAAQGYDLTKE